MSAVGPAHTGPGPLTGTDAREAARIVTGECVRLPFLPELPDRGVGSDVTGRTVALLADLPVDVSPRAWRLASTQGRLARRARDLLDRDLDAMEEAAELSGDPEGAEDPGRRLQVRVVGPWSLSARMELPGGLPVLTDRGARRDVAASLAEGSGATISALARRLSAGVRILLDEPMLWHVAAGTVPTPSRFDPVAPVPADQLAMSLCRFAQALRASGADEVLIRVPAGTEPEAPAVWTVLSEPPRDEVPLNGICLGAEDVLAGRSHPLLDCVGSVLGDGGLVQLEGFPRDRIRSVSEAETAAGALVALMDKLGAPRVSSLSRLVLSPSAAQLSGGTDTAVTGLSGARLVAETALRVAE